MKRSSSFEFPASILKYYFFCPRIPYFVLVLGVKERMTENMIEGKREHEKFYKRNEGMTNVFLKSEKFGIYGVVDRIVKTENGYIVIEFKNTEYNKKVVKSHLYQVAAYALMVEENFGRVKEVVIRYRKREVIFPFTIGIKNYVKSIIKKIREICEEGLVIEYKDKRRCKSCGFLRVCKGV